jgi:hypothetical protein
MITLCRNDWTSTTTLSRLADLQKQSSDKLIDSLARHGTKRRRRIASPLEPTGPPTLAGANEPLSSW